VKECKKIRSKLSAFIDNELTIEEEFKLKRHLAMCSECMRELEEMRGVWNLMDKIDDIEPSPYFWNVLYSKLISQRKSLFTPLESPTIYSGDDINKSFNSFRKGGSKALSFLTGFIKLNEVFQSVWNILEDLFGIPLRPTTIHTFSLDVFNDFPPESFGQIICPISPDKVK